MLVWTRQCACMMLELCCGACVMHGVGAGVLIQGHCCTCALMLELLFGHVSMPAGGAECSAVLLLFGHVSVPACGADHTCSDAALLCSDAGAVGWACLWGVDCLCVDYITGIGNAHAHNRVHSSSVLRLG